MDSNQAKTLPSGWRTARVADVLTVRNGYAVKSSEYCEDGVPLFRQSDINSDTIDISGAKRVSTRVMEECSGYLVREGDLLIGMSGSLGKIGRYPNKEPAVQNQRTGLLLLKPGFSAGFAKLLLKFVEPQIIAEGKGVAVQNVSAKEIEACTFPLPPAEERDRMVAEIEKQFTRLDAGVASLKWVQSALKRYRAALLKAACEGRLVPTEAELARKESRSYETGERLLQRILKERREQWRDKGKYKEPAVPDAEHLQQLPEGWTWGSLGQLAEFKNGINFSAAQKGQRGIPTIDVFNMYPTGIHVDLTNLYRVDLVPKEDHLLRKDDILFVRSSVRREGVGYVCLFKATNEPITYCGFIIRGRINTTDLFAPYIAYFLRSRSAREQIVRGASQVTITNVNQAALGKLPVPLPPLAEQKRIVAEVDRRLSVTEELQSVATNNLQRAARLRQAILARAFEGRVRATNFLE